jgi:hypothetical protein
VAFPEILMENFMSVFLGHNRFHSRPSQTHVIAGPRLFYFTPFDNDDDNDEKMVSLC